MSCAADNAYCIDAEEAARCAVSEPPRRRAVDQRVARGLGTATQEVRRELAGDARDDASVAGDGSSPDDNDGLSAPQIRYLAALRLRPSVGCGMRMGGV